MLERIANKVFKTFGYELIKKTSLSVFPIEISKDEMKFISEILYPNDAAIGPTFPSISIPSGQISNGKFNTSLARFASAI